MPFLGVSPTQEFTSVAKQSITGDGSASYTLNKGVSTENDLAVFVNDVRQEPGVAYTASANTITFTANLESTDSCYVLHIGRTFSSADSPGITDLAQEKVVTITTDGHIVPTANVTYDLGTSDLRFRDLYLSGSSLHLGVHEMTANATHVSIGNVATTGVMSGNAALMTSLNADELTSGTLPLARLPDDVTIVNDLTIGGDFVVNGNTTTIAANELKVEDSLIQLATNNEISDTLDIGFVGHYSNDGGNTALHTGFFRDASNEYYYLFNGYEEAAFDTATPPSTIDRTDNTFTLANFVANNVGMGFDPFLSNNYSTLNIRSTTGGQILMGRDSGTNDWDFFAYSASTHTAIGTAANTYLTFHTNSTGSSNERMRIELDGDVGIGTTSPTYKLVVSNDGAEGLEIDPVNVDGTIRVFAYDRTTTSYIAAQWFADSHSWTAGGSSTWMELDSTGNLNLNGNLHAGRGNDVSMSASADGMIQIDGNAYTGAITMDATAMYLYHNSGSRNLVLATNETAQLTLDYNGNVQLNRGSLLVHDSNGSIDNALRLTYAGTSGQGDINVRSTGGDTYLRILTSNAGTTGEVARFTHDGNFITQKSGATQVAGTIQHNNNDYMYLVSGTSGLIMGTTAGTHRIRLDTSTGQIRFHTPTAGQGMTLLDRGALCLGSTDTTSSGTATKLSVVGNIDLNGSAGSTNVLRLFSSASEKGQLYAHSGGVTLYAHSGSETNLYSNGSLTMQISDGNKVQINATNTPTYTLEVAGTNDINFRIMRNFQDNGIIRIGRSDGTNRWHEIVAYNDNVAASSYVAIDVHNGTVSSTYRAARIQGDGTIKAGGGLQAQLQRATSNVGVINNNRMPVGHYTPGETVFEIDPTWSAQQLQDYFNLTSGQCTWVEDSTAPGGYAIKITGNRSVGGNYASGFPYIPVDQDDIYYMECWIKNTGGGVTGHYMGSIDYSHTFASLGGNPGSFGYWVMSNFTTNSSSGWVKVSGYITGFGNNVGQFESGTKYWTPQALFNYRLDSGSRECYISGWKVIKVRSPGNRTFANNVTVQGTLSKTSGSFKIDHPLPSMANTHHLVHSFIEGPKADLIYSDTTQLTDGVAIVNIDEYATMTEGTFEALCKSVRCFTSNEDNWDAVKGSVSGNILTIECQNASSNAQVSWIVIGERKDPSMIAADWTDETGSVIVEPEKIAEVLNAEYLEAPEFEAANTA